MENQNHQQEPSNLICLIIKAPNEMFIRYDINNNYAHGIKDFLIEIPLTCYLTNYDLFIEKSNRRLDDNESIFEAGLIDFDVILIQPRLYSLNGIKEHINRLKYILSESCPVFNIHGPACPDLINKDKSKLILKANEYFGKINEIKQKMAEETVSSTEENTSNKNQESTKTSKDEQNKSQTEKNNIPETIKTAPAQNKEEESKMKEKQQNETDSNNKLLEQCLKKITESYQKIADTDFLTFRYQTYPQSALYENSTLKKHKKFKCLHSILESLSNQIIDQSTSSDLLYLEITTLEEKTLYITCTEKGFYINNSCITDGLLYIDTSPSKQSCSSFTLVNLLARASMQFREQFSQLITQIIDNDPIFACGSPSDKYLWIKNNTLRTTVDNEETLYYDYTYKKNDDNTIKTNRLNKEWNEEFQAFLDINFTQDPIQNLTKEKLLNEFYLLFKQTAIEGIKLIRQKKLAPFSFFESPKTNEFYYMHANIIFTILEDSYLTNRTYTKDDLKQTNLGANLDLKHVNYLNVNKYNFGMKFYLPLNCIIQYKGIRCHCQVITPGVIFNSDLLVGYGEGEQGVIKYDDDFHKAFSVLAEKLNIKPIQVEDSKTKVEFYGNPEIKGVNGVDKRKYLFDLIHLFPRDLNYNNEDNDRGCLLRPELIREYKLKLFTDQLTEETHKDISKYEQSCLDLNKKTKFDTTIGMKMKKLKIYNEEYAEDEKKLKELALFLKENMINKFIADVLKETENENAPNDSKSLTDYLHRYGINCRYLGEIYKRIKEKNWLSTLIETDIIRRCAKHIINQMIGTVPDYLVKGLTCHILNLLFAPGELIEKLNNKTIKINDHGELYICTKKDDKIDSSQITDNTTIPTTENKHTDNKNNKKKKKKKAKNQGNTEGEKNTMSNEENAIINDLKTMFNEMLDCSKMTNLHEEDKYVNNGHLFISPLDFYAKISLIAKEHFGFESTFSSPKYLNPTINKYGLLRDLCKTLGIQLEANDYELYNISSIQLQKDFNYYNLPFKPIHICDFNPVIKDYALPSELHRPLYEQAESYSKEGLLSEASEKYKQLIYTCNEIYGTINTYSALTYKKLGEISFFERDYLNGINYLQKSISLYEKLYKFDCNEIINSYALLATFNHFLNDHYNAFVYISRALEIANYTSPKNHPELITKFISIGMYFIEQNLVDKARGIVTKTIHLCEDFYSKTDINLQRPWLLISQLAIKSITINEGIYAYSNYINILKVKQCPIETIQKGEAILEELKAFEGELKKYSSMMRNKDEARSIYDELCRTKLNMAFWDDLEKPMSKILSDIQETVETK